MQKCDMLSLGKGLEMGTLQETGDLFDCANQKKHLPQIPGKSEALGLLCSQEAPLGQRELDMA